MESVKEFFQSIFDSYKDRIKSPLIGSFIISFVVYNWRAFTILFYSDWPVHTRIKWIEDHYFQERNFWFPFIIAVFYILILPYINLFFDWLLSIYNNKKILKVNFKRNAELIRKKAEAVLLREIADAEAGTSEINNLKERIEALQIENNSLIAQNLDDLNRHNAILEQFKIRENENIRKIEINKELEKVAEKLTNRDSVSLKDIREVVKLNGKFSDLDKQKFIAFVLEIHSNPSLVSINNLEKYEKMGLIEVIETGDLRQTQTTNFGELFFDFLTNNDYV